MLHRSPIRWSAAALLACAALAACDSSKHMAPAPTGSLSVTITSANGATPAVVVTGPNSYTKTLSATTTLSDLTLGSYTIVADSVVTPDSVVGSIIDTGHVSVASVTVTANQTATATVGYGMKSRMGGIWFANNGYGTIPELSATQLRASGTVDPADTLVTPLNGPAGLALDPSGNMWESSYGDSSRKLLMYTPAARNSGAAAPSLVLRSTAIGDGENITFDAHGNLWVADCDGALEEFTPSQLAAGGNQTPAVVINGGSVLSCPWALAFDAQGNVWVADEDENHVVEYSASQLTTSGTPTPADTIGATGNSLDDPTGVAFDANGNLWVANSGNTVVEFTSAQLTAGGAPTPTTALTLPNGVEGDGAAFDNRGTLWVTDCRGLVWGVTHAQLAGSGPVTPAVSDTVTMNGNFCPEQPMFDPYATAIGTGAAHIRHPVSAAAAFTKLKASERQRRLQRD